VSGLARKTAAKEYFSRTNKSFFLCKEQTKARAKHNARNGLTIAYEALYTDSIDTEYYEARENELNRVL
jgi:hypothetical protein